MEWFNYIIHTLSALNVPFVVHEDLSIEVFGTISRGMRFIIDCWHLINDNFHG